MEEEARRDREDSGRRAMRTRRSTATALAALVPAAVLSGLGVALAMTAALVPASPVAAKPVRISVDQPAGASGQ